MKIQNLLHLFSSIWFNIIIYFSDLTNRISDVLALESFDEEAPVFIDDADMAWEEHNNVDAPETPEKPETPEAVYWGPEPERNFEPKPTYGASQPSNYTPKLQVWRPVNYDSYFKSPVPAPADTYDGPLETPFSNYDAPSPTFNFFRSPVPAPADTYDGPLETPFSNYSAPLPIYSFAQGLSQLAIKTAQGLSKSAQGPVPAPADTYNGPLETPFSNNGAPSPTYTYRCAFCGIHEGKKSKKCGKCDKIVRFQSYISRKMTSYTWVGPYRIGQKSRRTLF